MNSYGDGIDVVPYDEDLSTSDNIHGFVISAVGQSEGPGLMGQVNITANSMTNVSGDAIYGYEALLEINNNILMNVGDGVDAEYSTLDISNNTMTNVSDWGVECTMSQMR